MATQRHVSETLRRAVSGGRVGHAYLFCGPRGVGKTTLARVLAMALNCPDRIPEGEPCGACESCVRIWSGHTALDVVEIDAASNRGVEDARELRTRAQYSPSEEGRFKVYILDEAHMLTREAWNALLKILEEPPPRVIFVFATTEPQKIQQSAAPILSRCQRFDFRRIGVTDIIVRLQEVLEREDLAGPEDALRTIARKADGGMRDALSLLDQVIALTGGPVSEEAVRQILGLVEEERYLELMDILLERQAGRIFPFVDRLVDEGYDIVEFYHGLVEGIRLLLRVRLEGESDLSDVREDLQPAFRERAAGFEAPDLVRMLALAAELETSGSLRRSVQPRMLVEMLLLRLTYLDRTVELEELIRGLGGAPLADPPSPRSVSPVAAPPAPSRTDVAGPDPSEAVPTGSRGTPAGTPSQDHPPARIESPPPEPVSLPPEPASPRTESSPPPPEAVSPPPEPPPPDAGATTPTEAASEPLTDDPSVAWDRVLRDRTHLPGGLSPFLQAGTIRIDESGALEVSLPPGPGLDRLNEKAVRVAVQRALHEHMVGSPQLVVVPQAAPGGADARITTEAVRQGRLRELIEREPLLGNAVEELDLELLD